MPVEKPLIGVSQREKEGPDKKVLDMYDVVSRRDTMDTRDKNDYDAKRLEIREIIMGLETRYNLEKILKTNDFVSLDLEGKIKFLENKLIELRQERMDLLKNEDLKFKYMDLRSWYDE
ncbi:MAG: hypothetical protein PHQ18_05065, partial [Patescibacteria group bacterium]|nr:hypothetical protein [Patescibacteria group bacterium]